MLQWLTWVLAWQARVKWPWFFAILEKSGWTHLFRGGHAGRGWYEGFMAHQTILTLGTPQLYDNWWFFAKLGAIFGWLNLIVKSSMLMKQVTIRHKPSKVVARHNLPHLTLEDRTHSVLSCVSASGQVLPPFMAYPRKRLVPQKMREGAILIWVSKNGWITEDFPSKTHAAGIGRTWFTYYHQCNWLCKMKWNTFTTCMSAI